jgi:hypothetical protein
LNIYRFRMHFLVSIFLIRKEKEELHNRVNHAVMIATLFSFLIFLCLPRFKIFLLISSFFISYFFFKFFYLIRKEKEKLLNRVSHAVMVAHSSQIGSKHKFTQIHFHFGLLNKFYSIFMQNLLEKSEYI